MLEKKLTTDVKQEGEKKFPAPSLFCPTNLILTEPTVSACRVSKPSLIETNQVRLNQSCSHHLFALI